MEQQESRQSVRKQRIKICLKAFDYRLIDNSAKEIVDTAKKTGANVRGPVPLPTRIERFDILRSPHVNKTSRDQLEICTYSRLIFIDDPEKKTGDALEKLDLPAGVNVEIKLLTEESKRTTVKKDGHVVKRLNQRERLKYKKTVHKEREQRKAEKSAQI